MELTREGIVPNPSVPSKPPLSFLTRKTLSAFKEFAPLSEQCFGMDTNVRLILEYALEREDVRDHLAFP